MEIGLIYSSKDPAQAKTREFIQKFVRERGILATFVESDQPVKSPIVTIDGEAIMDMRKKKRKKGPRMYPSIPDLARALEMHLWML